MNAPRRAGDVVECHVLSFFQRRATLLSSSKSGLPPRRCGRLAQRFAEHTLPYSAHVCEIDSSFMAARTGTGEELRNQYNAMWTENAANLRQTARFGSDTAVTTVQSATCNPARCCGHRG